MAFLRSERSLDTSLRRHPAEGVAAVGRTIHNRLREETRTRMPDTNASTDPFSRVYIGLRGELARAERAPGGQIRVDETAARFGISPTPVREALARLSGERLVRGCRRQGYFVPQPSASDLIQLFILSEMHLLTAIRMQSRQSRQSPQASGGPDEQLGTLPEDAALGRIFLTILARAEAPLLFDAGALILERLASARSTVDPAATRSLCADILPLLENRHFARLAGLLRSYHRARRANAVELAQAVAGLARPQGEYFRDMV